jgi:hypothetical protein
VLDTNLGCNLSNPCQTWWTEWHVQFSSLNNVSAIAKALEEISEWQEDIYSSEASMLVKNVCDCEIIATVFSLADIFSVKLPFSKYLQNMNIEIDVAKHNLKFLEDALIDKRNYAD